MTNLLLNKVFTEHHNYPDGEYISEDMLREIPEDICFMQNSRKVCVYFDKKNRKLHTSYFIGVDWIESEKIAIYVEPKLNNATLQTNYLEMLFSALKHPEISEHTHDLFELKFNQPQIEIAQKYDLLTPLLIVQFLSVVKEIVKKGLKKSYYKVEENLQSKIKGKVLVSKTINQDKLKNKLLKTYCRFEEFGYNNSENRLLKKTLLFIKQYLPLIKIPNSDEFTSQQLNFIMPVFENVSDTIDVNQIKHTKFNAFYKEYSQAIKLAKIILKRFGYNIVNTQNFETIKTPPFWIDMSKLFEIYVLGLLKDRFRVKDEVVYHLTTKANELDYLINSSDYKMVADAKYKPQYKNENLTEDLRQLSGYSRLKEVNKRLETNKFTAEEHQIYCVTDCLLIYPDLQAGKENLKNTNLREFPIKEYIQFYKIPVKIPTIGEKL